MNKIDTPYGGTQAIQRAVRILKVFGPDTSSLTPQEISHRAQLNRSTVYRLLSALETEGLLASDENGRYRLGPELIALGGLALRQVDLRAIALPILRELAKQSGETVDLEVLAGSHTMIIEEVTGDHLLSTSSNIGQLYPAHCTATGKALLAYLPQPGVDAILAEGLRACGPRAIRDQAVLRAELQAIAERGYATAYEELEAYLHSVGAPIFDHHGLAIAAVSISGPSARLPRRQEAQIARALLASCLEISQHLGYRT